MMKLIYLFFWGTIFTHDETSETKGTYSKVDFELNVEVKNLDNLNFNKCWKDSSIYSTGITNGCYPNLKIDSYQIFKDTINGVIQNWTAQNLGSKEASESASFVNNFTAGCYYQFNNLQAYGNIEIDGKSTVTPAWRLKEISENSNWRIENDPCHANLGVNWRIPTKEEWNALIAKYNWVDANTAFQSPLKLNTSGYLGSIHGTLDKRRIYGVYWTSCQYDNTQSWIIFIKNDFANSNIFSEKAFGYTIRCIEILK